MTVDAANLAPGDVLVMHADASLREHTGAWLIQRGPLMKKYPDKPWRWFSKSPELYNHVAMYTHTDGEGIRRGLEGRPGGFGWVNLDSSVAHEDTVANTGQVKTQAQRAELVAAAYRMIGIPYDWASIISFASEAAGFEFRVEEWPEQGMPSQVVCSTSIDYAYEATRLDNPGGYAETRATDPTDWGTWIKDNGYGYVT